MNAIELDIHREQAMSPIALAHIQRTERMLLLRAIVKDHAVMRSEKIRELEEINLRAEAAQRELSALCEEELRR
jgi:hypothetical protein